MEPPGPVAVLVVVVAGDSTPAIAEVIPEISSVENTGMGTAGLLTVSLAPIDTLYKLLLYGLYKPFILGRITANKKA